MTAFDPAAYGPVLAELLREAPLNPLDAGRPVGAVRPKLAALDDGSFRPHRVADPDMAAACRAGLWLRFNSLDESHQVSQGLDTAEGSYWHALMHRREGDFDNAKYWFRRVGRHPVFGPLGPEAAALVAAAGGPAPAPLTTQVPWDPFAFVDLCAACVRGRSAEEALCQQVQRREWELLFDYCYRHAVGAG
jgi:hypothetical protein